MKTKEADFGTLFRHWLKANHFYTASFELKQTEKDSILFSCVTEEQLDYAEAIRYSTGVLIRTVGVEGLPDYVYLQQVPAYIVIKYPQSFHIISSEVFAEEKRISKRKSLTEERAFEISTRSVKLKKEKKR